MRVVLIVGFEGELGKTPNNMSCKKHRRKSEKKKTKPAKCANVLHAYLRVIKET